MLSRIDIRALGVPELQRAFDELEKKMQNKIVREATKAAAEIIFHSILAKVPVDLGKLRDSLELKKMGGRRRIGYRVVTGKTEGVFHGSFVELGTAHQAPQSFMRSGLDENRTAATNVLIDHISDGISKIKATAHGN